VILNHLADVLGDSPLSDCVPALVHAAETEPAVRDFHHAYSARRRRRLTETIAAGVHSGEFPARVDPDAASVALAGAMFYRRLMTADAPDTDFITRLVDTMLGALTSPRY
jgi:TetR/AcrR family transcriptional regulator, regulator of autoinduction and epiphytic fitness